MDEEGIEFRTLADLLFQRQSWIHRRVESLHFQPDGQTLRRVSVDLSVPLGFQALRAVPIAILEKRVLSAFDAKDSSGDSLPVWTRGQNRSLATEILRSTLINGADPDALDLADRIVTFDPQASDDLNGDVDRLVATFRDRVDPQLGEPATRLAWDLCLGFLLVVALPTDLRPDGRTVVKFAYEEPVRATSWLNSIPIRTQVALDWGRGFHFEARPPEGIAVRCIEAGRVTPNPRDPDAMLWEAYAQSTPGPGGHVGHLLMSIENTPEVEAVDVDLAAIRRGLPTVAMISVWVTFLLVSASVIFSDQRWSWMRRDDSDSTVSTLLLLGPALAITFLSRGTEHSVSAMQLRGCRLALGLSGAILFAGAALAAELIEPGWTSRLWIFLEVCSLAAAGWYSYWWKLHTV